MDKYEFNIKVEQIKKQVKAGDYATAMKICDGIDWRRVSNVGLLSMVSEVYEKNYDFTEAKEILLMAYEKAPIGKRLLFKLCMLAIGEGNIEEAEAYYREFYDLAPDDARQHVLRYAILKAKGAPVDQLIASLEAYLKEELDEKYLYELAELYHEAGRHQECIATCDKIMLMFGIGNYVDRAIELKTIKEGCPLSESQKALIESREQYKEKIQAIEEEYNFAPDVKAIMQEEAEENRAQEDRFIVAGESSSVEIKTETAPAAETTQPAQETQPVYTINFIVERKTPEAGFESAKRLLRLMHEHTGSTNSVTKIKASKLNQIGIKASKEKLTGKDLIVEEAGDLAFDTVEQIVELIREEPDKRIIVLIDNPMQLTKIQNAHPRLLNYFHLDRDDAEEYAAKHPELNAQSAAIPKAKMSEQTATAHAGGNAASALREKAARAEAEEEARIAKAKAARDEEERAAMAARIREANGAAGIQEAGSAAGTQRAKAAAEPEMELDDFANYCKKYAESIDCSISGKSMLALYERIEIMEEDGIPLTQTNAVNLIEEAADKADKKSLGNLFTKKYDKEDRLILKEEHFIE